MNNQFYKSQQEKFKRLNKLDKFLNKYPSEKELIEQLYLLATIDSYRRIRKIDNINGFNENSIRNEFIRDFKEKNNYLKAFLNNKTIVLTAENQVYTRDYTQRTDIEFISSIHEHKFVIECKKLTSAEGRYINGREVAGGYKIDGLEKYIHLIYSEKDTEAAMASFVTKGKSTDITIKLKNKVKLFHAASDMDDYIQLKCIDWETSFQSNHIRNDKSSLKIYHLFFDFT